MFGMAWLIFENIISGRNHKSSFLSGKDVPVLENLRN